MVQGASSCAELYFSWLSSRHSSCPHSVKLPPHLEPGALNPRVPDPAAEPNDNPRVVAMTNMGLDDSIIVAKIAVFQLDVQAE
jgi:hypothetical protein